MAYLNKVMLIGNIGKDPEIRLSQSTGRKCATFSLATSKRYRDANGEQREQTTWHNIVAWGKIADIVEQLQLAKGTNLYVEGEIANRTWTDHAGAKRYVTEIHLGQGTEIIDWPPKDGQQRQSHPQDSAARQPAPRTQQQSRPQQQQPAPDYDSFDGEIPFADPYRGARCLII